MNLGRLGILPNLLFLPTNKSYFFQFFEDFLVAKTRGQSYKALNDRNLLF